MMVLFQQVLFESSGLLFMIFELFDILFENSSELQPPICYKSFKVLSTIEFGISSSKSALSPSSSIYDNVLSEGVLYLLSYSLKFYWNISPLNFPFENSSLYFSLPRANLIRLFIFGNSAT